MLLYREINQREKEQTIMPMQRDARYRDLPLSTFRESYWFDDEFKNRRAQDAAAEQEAFLAAQRDMDVDLTLDSDAWFDSIMEDLDPNENSYYQTGEDQPSLDDYLEATRGERISGGMSVSDAAAYYGGSPAVLDEARGRRSTYVSSSPYSSSRGRYTGKKLPSPYRERVNKDVLGLATLNKDALAEFKSAKGVN
jgi:hypothetical protein